MSTQQPGLAADGLLSPSRRSLTVGLVLIVTLVGFEALAVATVMPVVQRDLGGLRLYGLVFSVFMLTNILGIVFVGTQAERRALSSPYALGVVLFGAGLGLAGLAPTMALLVMARGVQGFGAGVISTATVITIGLGYPESLRPRMMAALSTAWIVPGLLGPGLAGAVAEYLSWRLVFLGLLPLLLLATSLTLPVFRSLGKLQDGPAQGAQIPYAVLLAVGAGAVLAGFTSGLLLPGAVLVVVGTIISIIGLGKLVPAGTFRLAPGLPVAVATMGLLSVPFFGAEAFLPLMLTHVRGQSATVAGLALTSATLTWTAGAWLQARYSTRWPSRSIVVTGILLVGIGIAVAGATTLTAVPTPTAVIGWGTAGLGMGLAYNTVFVVVLAESPPDQVGSASASMQLANVLGVALGTAIGGAVITAGDSAHWATSMSIEAVFALMVAFAVLGCLTARRLTR